MVVMEEEEEVGKGIQIKKRKESDHEEKLLKDI